MAGGIVLIENYYQKTVELYNSRTGKSPALLFANTCMPMTFALAVRCITSGSLLANTAMCAMPRAQLEPRTANSR